MTIRRILVPATTLLLMVGTLMFVSSCKKDEDVPPPAPQVTGNVSSLNLVADAGGEVTLTVVAPGKFKSIEATADNGTVVVDGVTGTGTTAGTAHLAYTAPEGVGNYNITVMVTDQTNQTGKLTITVAVTAKPPVNVPAGNVSGTWERNTTYIAGGTLIVPAGQTLTIEEGVTIVFDGTGSNAAPEFSIQGKLYAIGTAEKPIMMTIPEGKRTKANIFAGTWGGLQALPSATEMVLQYVVIEYTGAPTGAGNPSFYSGSPYADGDPRYGILFSNTSGKLVMQHSVIRYTADDGMRVTGGSFLITNNQYILTGKTGGEAVNVKSSAIGTVAFNLMYRAATNAVKWSNVSGNAATPQNDVDVFNNTAIECGWRQTKAGRGGSFNVEKGGRGTSYNNLIVNCHYGVKEVKDADTLNIGVGYQHYFGTDAVMTGAFYPSDGILKNGKFETGHDIQGAAGANDPKFVNYSVTGYVSTFPVDPASLDYPPAMDFHLQAGAPGLGHGKTGFTTKASITINGVTYSTPAPVANIGLYGTN